MRIPVYSENPKTKRLEFRPPDSTANPYLAFAALLMACIDGVQNKINPGEPLDKDTYELSKAEAAKVPTVQVRWRNPSLPWKRIISFF